MANMRYEEALNLAMGVLESFEERKSPLSSSCLKAVRLASLLGDRNRTEEWSKITARLGELENAIEASQIRLKGDPQKKVVRQIELLTREYQEIGNTLYEGVVNIYLGLKYGSVPQEIFEKIRRRADKNLAEIIPEALEKFVSVYNNLVSENPEDWSNAVHSCRRILQAVADVLFPPNTSGVSEIEHKGKKIAVGRDAYKNRLMLYAESKANSERFLDIVGSNLEYLGNRLDAIYEATSKGTHSNILSREEAERYIIYTYLFLGDILSLSEKQPQ